MKKVVALLMATVFLFSVFGFGAMSSNYVSAASTQFPRNETLYTANSVPPTSANPFQGGNIIGIDGLIFEPLFMLNFMQAKLVPWLAESGRWINSTVYQVVLRKGTTWQDGKPLTANDVKFSFEYYKELGLKKFPGLKEINVVNNRTVDFVFSGQINYPLWNQDLYTVLIIPEHIFKNLKPSQVKTMTFTGDQKKYLVGSGPYKLLKVVTGQKSILVRNDNWWGAKEGYFKLPAPRYIIQLYIPSNSQAVNAFLKGDLDVATYYMNFGRIKAQAPFLVSWLNKPPYFPPVAPVVLYMNDKKYPFNITLFRRAIADAINPQMIVYFGPLGAVPDESPLGPPMNWVKKDIGLQQLEKEYGWQYGNVAEANKILDQLGFKWDSKHQYRIDPKTGKPLKFTFLVCSGCDDWISTAKIVINQLKAIGIQVTLKEGDWTTVFMKNLKAGTFDLSLHWAGTFAVDPYVVYYNLLYYKNSTDKGMANFGDYYNPQVNKLLEEAAATPDMNKRLQYIRQITEIWLKDAPYIPLYTATLFYEASTKYWTNWPNINNPYGVPIFWPGFGTQGTALALLGVKPAGASSSTTSTTTSTTHTTSSTSSMTTTSTTTHTTSSTSTSSTSSTITTSSSSSSSTSPTSTTSSKKSICGPATIVGLALLPLLLRKRRR